MDSHEVSSTLTAAPQTQTSEGDRVHAGVAVLTHRMLWDLITGFMIGFPYSVRKFYKENIPDAPWGDRRIGGLKGKGVLLHLAIAANNHEMLGMLFELASQEHYRHDPKLSFEKIMRCAILHSRVDVLKRGETQSDKPGLAMGACADGPRAQTRRSGSASGRVVVRASASRSLPNRGMAHDVPRG